MAGVNPLSNFAVEYAVAPALRQSVHRERSRKMANKHTMTPDEPGARSISRRAMIGAAALTVPAVAVMTTVPAFAASGSRSVSIAAVPVLEPQSSTASTADARSAADPSQLAWRVTVTVRDPSGQPLSGQYVELTAPQAISFDEPMGYTGGEGTFVTSAWTPVEFDGTLLVTATSSGAGGTVTASSALSVQPSSVRVTFSSAIGDSRERPAVWAGGSATVTAAVLNASGAMLPGKTVWFHTSGGWCGESGGSGGARGWFATTFHAWDTVNTTATVTAECGSATGSGTLAVVDRRVSLSLSQTTVRVGESVQVTLTATDNSGVPLPAGSSVGLSTPSTKPGAEDVSKQTQSSWVSKNSARGVTDSAGRCVWTLRARTAGVSQRVVGIARTGNGELVTVSAVLTIVS